MGSINKVKKEVSNEYLKKIIKIDKNHLGKYGKKMSLKELDVLCER